MATSRSRPTTSTRRSRASPSRESNRRSRRTACATAARACASYGIPTGTASRSSSALPDPGTLPVGMADTTKIAKNLERFAQAIAAHDRENPTHTAWGIGLAHFDLERLGLEEGEEILPGIVIQGDNGVTGNFRVLCDGQHDEEREAAEEEVVEAVATTTVGGDRGEQRSF